MVLTVVFFLFAVSLSLLTTDRGWAILAVSSGVNLLLFRLFRENVSSYSPLLYGLVDYLTALFLLRFSGRVFAILQSICLQSAILINLLLFIELRTVNGAIYANYQSLITTITIVQMLIGLYNVPKLRDKYGSDSGFRFSNIHFRKTDS